MYIMFHMYYTITISALAITEKFVNENISRDETSTGHIGFDLLKPFICSNH